MSSMVREVTAGEAARIIQFRLSGLAFAKIQRYWSDWPLPRFQEALRNIPDNLTSKDHKDSYNAIRMNPDSHAILYARAVGPKIAHELKRVFTHPVGV